MARKRAKASLAALGEEGQAQAMARFAVLRPHLEEGVPLARAAREAGVPLRTVQRWLARHRRDGLAGLARPVRGDAGSHRASPELVALIEGMGLKRPRSSAAAIHRRVRDVAAARGWRAPSYGTVHAILSCLDPAMVTLALDGPAAYRDCYEPADPSASRRGAQRALAGRSHPARRPRPRRGRQAGPPVAHDGARRSLPRGRRVHGVPRRALGDRHLPGPAPRDPAQGRPLMAGVRHPGRALRGSRPRLHRQPSRPGRGRAPLPGGLPRRRATAGPGQGRAAVRHPHGRAAAGAARAPRRRQAGHAAAPVAGGAGPGRRRLHRRHVPPPPPQRDRPNAARRSARARFSAAAAREPGGARPAAGHARPARPRVVRRDGIHFEGLRYTSPTLAGYVREPVTIRYDPRDLSEIRVFHRDRSLCRAVSEEHAGGAVTLKDIEAARRAHRRALRAGINERVAKVADYLPVHADPPPRLAKTERPPRPARTRLRLYEEDGP